MRTVTKSFSVSPGAAAVKFRDGGDDLTFTAFVSRFGNVDSQGEVVDKGAFSKTLAERDEVPCVWSHMWSDPFNYIGVAKCSETDEGLYVEATLDGSNPTARQVHRLMQLGVIREFSFSANLEDWYVDSDDVVHLAQLDLFEVGPCLVGANRETSLETVSASRNPDKEKGDDVADDATVDTAAEGVVKTSPDAETETSAEGADDTTPAAEAAAAAEVAAEPDAPTPPGLADLAQAILAAVQAQTAAADSGGSEPDDETSVPVPAEEPVTEEPAADEPQGDTEEDFFRSLLQDVADGLDHGESAVTILQGLVDSIDSRISGGKED